VLSHGDDADLVAVFLAEERLGAERARVVGGHEARLDRGVLADEGVHLALDAGQLLGSEGLGVGEVEAEAVLGVEASPLRDVVAQRASQRLVEQVGRGVVGADRGAAGVVDRQPAGWPRWSVPVGHLRLVEDDARGAACVEDARACRCRS
jgi:hypothetical protein